ncbi:MAG: DEAD/DEAH box helicase [Acidobacteria bacterium]|nr:DEAD/DEAH box helicase [Acidobacteriota bacterium]
MFESAPFNDTPVSFDALGLDARLSRAVSDLGFEKTTPVQSAVFPAIAAGDDLVACAQTGTGKTIAFLLPTLQRLLANQAQARRTPRLLILAPTRELALQIEDDVRSLVRYARFSGVTVCGGMSMGAQARALRGGVDIVVATPGRLIDHINRGGATFEHLEVLVLDEADRMVDMGFWPDVQRIVGVLPATRQTLLFSATTSRDVMKAAKDIMRDPKMMQVGKSGGLAPTITHVSHHIASDAKAEWLNSFLARTPQHALVFVRTKHRADRLVQTLASHGHRCVPLHADRSQGQRSAAVEGFKTGRFRVLVATDIAARGLDVDGISHVINFEPPSTVDAYVHRVGRTGRAEASGTAVTLIAPDERQTMRAIERALQLKTVPA